MDIVEISPIEQYVIDRVRAMRKEHGLSQRDLAYQLDIDQSFLAAIESPKNRAKYNLSLLNEIAKIFKCSPKDFLPDLPL